MLIYNIENEVLSGNLDGVRSNLPYLMDTVDFLLTQDDLGSNPEYVKELKAVTAASDGNLGAQLSKLEALGYLVCKKEFVNKKPQSTYIITEKGMNQFREYVEMLEELLHQSEKEC